MTRKIYRRLNVCDIAETVNMSKYREGHILNKILSMRKLYVDVDYPAKSETVTEVYYAEIDPNDISLIHNLVVTS